MAFRLEVLAKNLALSFENRNARFTAAIFTLLQLFRWPSLGQLDESPRKRLVLFVKTILLIADHRCSLRTSCESTLENPFRSRPAAKAAPISDR